MYLPEEDTGTNKWFRYVYGMSILVDAINEEGIIMKKLLAILLVLMLGAMPSMFGLAETPADETGPQEGYNLTDQGIDISLYENGTTGYQWFCEVDDESILLLEKDEFVAPKVEEEMTGNGGMHTWHFKAGDDGEGIVMFYYERPWESSRDEDDEEEWDEEDSFEDDSEYDDIMPARILCFTVTVEDGKVISCDEEDLTESDNEGDGEGAIASYQGETGGVDLDVFEDMTAEDTPDGQLLTSADGLTTILIRYLPGDDADALFEKYKDDESVAKAFDDPDKGIQVAASSVDDESDVPYVMVVYYMPEGITEYTAYKAPQGGVLHVTTTYFLGTDDDEEYEPDNESPLASAGSPIK